MSNSIQQILVGTDFSEPSINAVLHADALAQLCQANLTALFALNAERSRIEPRLGPQEHGEPKGHWAP